MKGIMYKDGKIYEIEEEFDLVDDIIKNRRVKVIREIGTVPKGKTSFEKRVEDLESAVEKLADLLQNLLKKQRI